MFDLPHVASRVFGTPLMIARAKLEVILGVLAPRLAGGAVVAPIDAEADPAPATSITVERIAVVSVIGTLVSRSGYLTATSGLVSYADIGEAIVAAMDDPTVPAEFSGVSPERHGLLRQRALSALYSSEITEIAELEEAVSVAEMAVESGRDEVRLEVGGIDKQKFDELAAPIEAKHAAPWLRRRGGEVHVVDLERRVERQPTEEELATGIIANTREEYLREQSAAPAAA
jgi:hypothetical protein